MFECRSTAGGRRQELEELHAFAQKGGLSFGLPFEPGTVVSLLGVEIFQLYGTLVCDLSRSVRDRIQKIKTTKDYTKSIIRKHRLEITRFLRLVLGNAEAMGDALDEIIQLISNCLPTLLEPLIMYGWTSVYEKEYKGYEIFHGVLEWRWLLMLIAMGTKQPMRSSAVKLYRELMADMLVLVFHQFRLNSIEDAVRESPFACGCVKQMWLGMLSIAEKNAAEIDFWMVLCDSMPTMLKERKDGYLFKIWLISALAQFYEIKVLRDAQLVPLVTLPPNPIVVDDVVKELVRADCREEHVRCFLILLKPIVTGLWPVRYEGVIAAWDYFTVRLNSSFLLKNDLLSNMGCISRSVSEFIDQGCTVAAPESTLDSLDYKTNSFRMFLTILAAVIGHFTKQSSKRNVQIIFNRIFLKLGPNKYENMTEQGIYNLSLMLLTMVSATTYQEDFPRVSKQMQMVRLLDKSAHLPVDATVKRIVMATQAHMAVLVLLGRSNTYDKTAHIRTLLQSIQAAYQKYGSRLQPAMNALAEGVVLLYEEARKKGSFNRGELSLVGPWMDKYLHGCCDAGWHRLLDAIADAMKQQVVAHEEFGKAVNEHLYPFVKTRFSKNSPAPSCVVRMAAQLTMFAAESLEPAVFRSLINDFIHCPTAHTDQVLQYLKAITQCAIVMHQLDETTIIRQWLKMGFYYGHEDLLELSRVVHGLSEFKLLCDIPEYDMFEGSDIPIQLFFTFVGRRFRAADSGQQMEMRMKLHCTFQHFHKWIPEPKGIVRQRILSVLILALKECPQAFYISSNASCLYHLAFQHYFLPFSVLTDRNVPLDFIQDMARVWHRLMEVLGNMEYSTNLVFGDNVSNMLTKWIPQFAKLRDPADALQTFMLFFCGRNEQLVLFSMPRFVAAYVDLKRCLPQPNAQPAVKMLHRLMEALLLRQDYGKMALLIRIAGLQIIVHAFMCNETFPTRAIAMEMVCTMLASTDGPSNMVRQEVRGALAAFTRKHLSMSADPYFSFMFRLANRNPALIRSLLDTVRQELATAERLRGQGTDSFLRGWMMRLERMVNVNVNEA